MSERSAAIQSAEHKKGERERERGGTHSSSPIWTVQTKTRAPSPPPTTPTIQYILEGASYFCHTLSDTGWLKATITQSESDLPNGLFSSPYRTLILTPCSSIRVDREQSSPSSSVPPRRRVCVQCKDPLAARGHGGSCASPPPVCRKKPPPPSCLPNPRFLPPLMFVHMLILLSTRQASLDLLAGGWVPASCNPTLN